MVTRTSQWHELPELLQLRKILERMTAIPISANSSTDKVTKYANLDIQFHLEIGRLSGNAIMTSFLKELLHEFKARLDRIRWSDCRREKSHARIYSALVKGNVEQARGEIRDHIRTVYDSLLDEMRNSPAMNRR